MEKPFNDLAFSAAISECDGKKVISTCPITTLIGMLQKKAEEINSRSTNNLPLHQMFSPITIEKRENGSYLISSPTFTSGSINRHILKVTTMEHKLPSVCLNCELIKNLSAKPVELPPTYRRY